MHEFIPNYIDLINFKTNVDLINEKYDLKKKKKKPLESMIVEKILNVTIGGFKIQLLGIRKI